MGMKMENEMMDPQENDQSPQEGGQNPMEMLLKEQANFHERLESRQVVWVKLVQVQADSAQVDIGEKHEGVIPLSDFTPGNVPPAGSRIPAVLVSRGRENRPAVLSYKKARLQLGWEQVLKAFKEKARVRGRVTAAIKGGFLVDVSGVPAFLPASLADLRPVRKPDSMLNTGVRCYILEVNEEKKQLILSRKAVLEEEARKRWDGLAAKLKIGDVMIGRVSHVGSAGIAVNIGGVEGFVPEADLAWKEPRKAKEAIAPGQKLRLKILRIETEARKITLGAKQLQPNPADILRKKYPLKANLAAKVVEVKQPEGVRLSVTDAVAAFCAASELPEIVSEHPAKPHPESKGAAPRVRWPSVGDSVQVVVLGVNPTTFELSVSIRRFEDMQDRKRIAKYLKTPSPLTLGQILTSEEDQ